jgi:putative membrane protein
MKIKLVFGLILLGLVAVVALQNAEIVTVKFLLWQFSLPRALMILASMGVGLIAGLLFGTLLSVRSKISKSS